MRLLDLHILIEICHSIASVTLPRTSRCSVKKWSDSCVK